MVYQKGKLNSNEQATLAEVEARMNAAGEDTALFHDIRNLIVELQTHAEDNWELYQQAVEDAAGVDL